MLPLIIPSTQAKPAGGDNIIYNSTLFSNFRKAFRYFRM